MKSLGQSNPIQVWMEMTPTHLHAWRGSAGVDVPLEREPDGHWTSGTPDRVVDAIKSLVADRPWLARLQLFCSLSSRGVILRPVVLPAAPSVELPRLLQLRMEAEFPLPPEQLAWGWLPLPGAGSAERPVLLGAVKIEVLKALQDLFAPLEAELFFSIAALDRVSLLPGDNAGGIVLDWSLGHGELTFQRPGIPPSVRWLQGGQVRLLEALHTHLGWTSEQALESLKALGPQAPNPSIEPVLDEALQPLTQALSAAGREPIYLGGSCASVPVVAHILATRHSNLGVLRRLELTPGPGRTSANVGLERSVVGGKELARLVLRAQAIEVSKTGIRGLPWRQVAVCAALLFAILAVPYLEALLLRPALARRVGRLKTAEPELALIDRELSFLRYLEQNQSPYLDALYVIAKSAPPGCHVDSVSLNRRGEVGLNGFLQNLNLVGEFRVKLIDSGFFSSVVMEDQTPTPDRQRINFRMTAQWKAPSDREGLQIGPVLTNPVPAGVSNAPTIKAAPIPQKSP